MTNLIHTCFILQYVYFNPLHISIIICLSSGGWNVLMHLVSSFSVSGCPVHRLRLRSSDNVVNVEPNHINWGAMREEKFREFVYIVTVN